MFHDEQYISWLTRGWSQYFQFSDKPNISWPTRGWSRNLQFSDKPNISWPTNCWSWNSKLSSWSPKSWVSWQMLCFVTNHWLVLKTIKNHWLVMLHETATIQTYKLTTVTSVFIKSFVNKYLLPSVLWLYEYYDLWVYDYVPNFEFVVGLLGVLDNLVMKFQLW